MSHFDSIFKVVCIIIIIIIASYMKRDKVVKAFHDSPIVCGIGVLVGVIIILILFGLLSTSVVNHSIH